MEVLVHVREQEVCEKWMGQAVEQVEDTDWRVYSRRRAKGQWRAMEQAAMRRGWTKDMARDKVYDRG